MRWPTHTDGECPIKNTNLVVFENNIPTMMHVLFSRQPKFKHHFHIPPNICIYQWDANLQIYANKGDHWTREILGTDASLNLLHIMSRIRSSQ